MKRERGHRVVTYAQMTALSPAERADLTQRLVEHAQRTDHTITMFPSMAGRQPLCAPADWSWNAKCSCRASREVMSIAAAKRWHRAHKAEVVEQRERDAQETLL